MPLPDGRMLTANEGLMVALGYRVITVLIAAVGICYYLGSREQLAEALHEADLEAEEEQPLDQAAVSHTAA